MYCYNYEQKQNLIKYGILFSAYDKYYDSIQMGLPALYYSGRNNPPHPEIWINYFLRMVQLYSEKVCGLQFSSNEAYVEGSISYLKGKEKELLLILIRKYKREFTPIEVSKELKVTNKTIINRLAALSKNGFVVPIIVNQRIRSYELSDFTKDHEKEIIKCIKWNSYFVPKEEAAGNLILVSYSKKVYG